MSADSPTSSETILLVGLNNGQDDRWFTSSAINLTGDNDGTTVLMHRMDTDSPEFEPRRSNYTVPSSLGKLVGSAMNAHRIIASENVGEAFSRDIRAAEQFLLGAGPLTFYEEYYGAEAIK